MEWVGLEGFEMVCLVLGVVFGVLNTQWNMREFSNSISLWMGLSPAQTFFTVFLPPLLLDSAARVDYFMFKKVCIRFTLSITGEYVHQSS